MLLIGDFAMICCEGACVSSERFMLCAPWLLLILNIAVNKRNKLQTTLSERKRGHSLRENATTLSERKRGPCLRVLARYHITAHRVLSCCELTLPPALLLRRTPGGSSTIRPPLFIEKEPVPERARLWRARIRDPRIRSSHSI